MEWQIIFRGYNKVEIVHFLTYFATFFIAHANPNTICIIISNKISHFIIIKIHSTFPIRSTASSIRCRGMVSARRT